jgi:hypothetical protein
MSQDPEEPEAPSPNQDPKLASVLEFSYSLLIFAETPSSVLAIKGIIPFFPIRTWEQLWLDKQREILASNYTSPAESFRPLSDASADMQKVILGACKRLRLDPAIIKWPTMVNDIPEGLQDIRNIRDWLVNNDLINVEPADPEASSEQARSSKGGIYFWFCQLI